MYIIETWGIFYSSHVHYQNFKSFLFLSCILSKREVFFVSVMYTIETWSVFGFLIETWDIFCIFNVHYRNVKQFFFLMYTIETWGIFSFWHVHCRNLQSFLFFSCTLSEREGFFCFSLVPYWNVNSSCFSYVRDQNEVIFVFLRYTIET